MNKQELINSIIDMQDFLFEMGAEDEMKRVYTKDKLKKMDQRLLEVIYNRTKKSQDKVAEWNKYEILFGEYLDFI